jgi:predicted membrane-bound spermidine synthase
MIQHPDISSSAAEFEIQPNGAVRRLYVIETPLVLDANDVGYDKDRVSAVLDAAVQWAEKHRNIYDNVIVRRAK